MPIERTTENIGTKIARRQVDRVTVSAPFGSDESSTIREMFRDRSYTFEEQFGKNIELIAMSVLAKVGITSPSRSFPDGAESHSWREQVKFHRFAEDSNEDYAARILDKLVLLRRHLRRKDPDAAAAGGVELGALVTEAHFNLAWGDHAIRGEKILEAARRGAPPPGRTAARDVDMAKYFISRRGNGLSDTALKTKIGRENKLERSAAIDAINRGLKVLSG